MKKKAAAKKASKRNAKPKRASKPAEPVNVILDRRGTRFDPEGHALTPEGAPHTDSAGHFIEKASHYDGAAKAHYPDSFRHA